MTSAGPLLSRAAQWLTFASAVSILFSIAISQILLALALAALLLSGTRLRLPPIWLPLALFLGATLVSLALSGNPAGGLPQVRKIYVFLVLLIAYSTLRDVVLIRGLFLCWAGAGSVIALRSFVQFGNKLEEARALGRNFYDYYVPERITGFMSHWMTFSGQEMFVLLMLAAFLFFSPYARKRLWIWLSCALVTGVALLLGYTRSIIWLATPAAGFVPALVLESPSSAGCRPSPRPLFSRSARHPSASVSLRCSSHARKSIPTSTELCPGARACA